MRTSFSIFVPLLVAVAFAPQAMAQVASDDSPGRDEQITVIRAGTIITVSGETISNGEIVIIDGQIELVGRQLDYPRSATIIDARDKVVMPGLVHAHTRHGLENLSRNGVNGNITVDEELYWATMDLEALVEHGVTAIGIYPDGSGVTGMASSYRSGGPVDARQFDATAYLNVTMNNPSRDKRQLREGLSKAREELEKIRTAREEWEQKQREAAEQQQDDNGGDGGGGDDDDGDDDGDDGDGRRQDEEVQEQEEPAKFEPPQTDASVQPLMDLIEKKADFAPLVSISSASDLLHLNDVLKDEEFEWRLIVSNGRSTDFHNVIDQFQERGGLVLTEPGITTITQTDTRYNLPAALEKAGCEVAFMPTGTSDRQLGAYLAEVANTVRAGMSRESALKAMTLHAAKVIGAEASIGSIEKGKSADLIILDGDPLNPLSRIERVMIGGETVYESESDE